MTVTDLLHALDGCAPDAEITAGILSASTIELRADGELLGYLDA